MIKIPLFPEYSTVVRLMKIIDGMPVQDFKSMWNTVWGLRGTPQNTVDWTEPDQWIPERLTGKDKDVATKIWKESNKTVNPRWTRGDQFLMTGYSLISEFNGLYALTEFGKAFIGKPENEVMQKIDFEEGLVQVLRQLSLIKNGKRADLLEEWEEYTQYNSNIKQDSVIKDYLRRRVVNLIDRKYIKREGSPYLLSIWGKDFIPGQTSKRYWKGIA